MTNFYHLISLLQLAVLASCCSNNNITSIGSCQKIGNCKFGYNEFIFHEPSNVFAKQIVIVTEKTTERPNISHMAYIDTHGNFRKMTSGDEIQKTNWISKNNNLTKMAWVWKGQVSEDFTTSNASSKLIIRSHSKMQFDIYLFYFKSLRQIPFGVRLFPH